MGKRTETDWERVSRVYRRVIERIYELATEVPSLDYVLSEEVGTTSLDDVQALYTRDRPGLDVAWTPRAGATVEHDDKVYTVAYYTIIVDGRNGSASLTARLRLADAQQREGAGE